MAHSTETKSTHRVALALSAVLLGLALFLGTQTIANPFSDRERAQLLMQFTRAQETEMRDLRNQHSSSLKDLVKRQREELKKFEKEDVVVQRQFRHEHRGQGRQIREFVMQGRAKRDSLLKSQIETKKQVQEEQNFSRKSLKQKQDENMRAFKNALDKNERPADDLWPGKSAPKS